MKLREFYRVVTEPCLFTIIIIIIIIIIYHIPLIKYMNKYY